MTEKSYIILILICLVVLVVAVPVVSAKEVTAKVDDKGLMVSSRYGILGTLHTEYGTIIVQDEDYNNIQINDTISYNTDKDTFWDIYWKVKKVN